MTRLFSKLPWFATAPLIAGAAIALAVAIQYFVGPFFERSFLDEPDPLAAIGAPTGSPPVVGDPKAQPSAAPASPIGAVAAAPTAPAPAPTALTATPTSPPTQASSPSSPATVAPTTVQPTATAIATTGVIAPSPSPTPNQGSQAAVLAQGNFRDGEPGHNGKGAARIIRDASGNLILRLENFSVTNGPDLHVFLTTTNGYDGDRIDLGKLKATDGNQNYAIPAGTDVTKYKSAIVWCVSFRVLFSIATLGAP